MTRCRQRFYFREPLTLVPDLDDITCALGNLCRFTGQVKTFYSVAQHCCLVADITEWLGGSRFEALMHDASEAYLGDVAAPLKLQPELDGYRELEAKVERLIAKHWDLEWPMSQTVKDADALALVVEAKALTKIPLDELVDGQGHSLAGLPQAKTVLDKFKLRRCWEPAEAGRKMLRAATKAAKEGGFTCKK
jgi:hypothetical protein